MLTTTASDFGGQPQAGERCRSRWTTITHNLNVPYKRWVTLALVRGGLRTPARRPGTARPLVVVAARGSIMIIRPSCLACAR